MSRKRKALSLKDKIEILKEFDRSAGLTKVELAKKLDIPVSTLKTIVYDRKKIEDRAAACGSFASKKLRVQEGKFPEVEDILITFLTQCRASNIPVSGPLLMEKAQEIAVKLNVKGACFSTGWLHKFKMRHGISSQVISGESKDAPDETVDEWFKNLPSKIDGYQLKNIYNVDETGLFYNLMPARTLAFKGDNCHGGKKSKDRLTVLLCANADGSDKMTPLIIGKSQKPRCFKNVKTLPVSYDANKTAWMTANIFIEWLKKIDKDMKKQKRKILLFMDQSTAHPQETDFLQNVKVVFFPPNCTSKLQPLDLGIIKNLKVHYRKRLIQHALQSITTGNIHKKVNVLQAINMISLAWNQVKSKTIKNCFIKGGFPDPKQDERDISDENDDESDDETIIIDEEDWNLLRAEITFEEYVNCDIDIMTSELCTVDQLIENKLSGDKVSEDEDECEEVTPPSFQDAMDSIEKLRTYFVCQNSTSEKTFNELNSIHNAVLNTRRQSERQTTITDFFN